MGLILPGVRNYLAGRRRAGPCPAPSPVRPIERPGRPERVPG